MLYHINGLFLAQNSIESLPFEPLHHFELQIHEFLPSASEPYRPFATPKSGLAIFLVGLEP